MLMRNSDMICMRKRRVWGLIAAPAIFCQHIFLLSALFRRGGGTLFVSKEPNIQCQHTLLECFRGGLCIVFMQPPTRGALLHPFRPVGSMCPVLSRRSWGDCSSTTAVSVSRLSSSQQELKNACLSSTLWYLEKKSVWCCDENVPTPACLACQLHPRTRLCLSQRRETIVTLETWCINEGAKWNGALIYRSVASCNGLAVIEVPGWRKALTPHLYLSSCHFREDAANAATQQLKAAVFINNFSSFYFFSFSSGLLNDCRCARAFSNYAA